MQSSHDPSWDLYPETVLELHSVDGTVRIDLRDPVTPALATRLAHLGPTASFAVITSDNPYGRERASAENARGRAVLGHELEGRTVLHVHADGVSPDGAHREQGYAVWLDVEDARHIARAHGQSAFFWFDGTAFRIEGALVSALPRELPLQRNATG